MIRKVKQKSKTFKDIKVGNFFILNGITYLKVNKFNRSTNGDVNSIQVWSGDEALVKENTEVEEFAKITFEIKDVE